MYGVRVHIGSLTAAAFLGALFCWPPWWMWMTGSRLEHGNGLVLTFLLPACSYVGYQLARRVIKKPGTAAYAGAWLFGVHFFFIPMTYIMSFLAGQSMTFGEWRDFFLLWAMFPISAVILGTYWGSLGGLLVISIYLTVVMIRASSVTGVRPADDAGAAPAGA